jgi:hypothetical protein
MKSLLFFFVLITSLQINCPAQDSARHASRIDKTIRDMETDEIISKYYKYDTVEFNDFGETEVRIVKFEVSRRKSGEIVKIVSEQQGYLKTVESYYYQNNKAIKAVIKWTLPDTSWDSEIFYDNGKVIAQRHKAAPLNPVAFLELANQYLKEQGK